MKLAIEDGDVIGDGPDNKWHSLAGNEETEKSSIGENCFLGGHTTKTTTIATTTTTKMSTEDGWVVRNVGSRKDDT